RFLVIVVEPINVQNLLQVTQVSSAIDHPASFVQLNDIGGFVFVGKFTGDGFEYVHRCHQPVNHAEFIGDDDQLTTALFERLDQGQNIDGFGNHQRFAQLFNVDLALGQNIGYQVGGA